MRKSRKKSLEGAVSPIWASREAEEKCDIDPNTIKDKLQSIRHGLEKDITSLVSRLGGSPLIFDENRLIIIKNFLFLSHLIGEVNILFATVWRYTTIDEAWRIIAPSLSDAVEDIQKLRENGESLIQSGAELTSFYLKGLMKNFHHFLLWFDSHLEDRISEVTELTPLEIRLIDLLSCCPTVDFQLTLTRVIRNGRYCALTGTYKILNLQSLYDMPDFNQTGSANNSKESKLIKFIRDSVRYDNTVYLQSIINSLSVSECELLAERDENKLENLRSLCVNYEKVLNELFQVPVHDSYTTTIGETRYYHDIYKRQLRYDENVALSADISIPVLSDKHLPLILSRTQTGHSSDIVESKKDTLVSISKLKEYNICFGGTSKPEIKLNIIYNKGPQSTCKILVVGGYDKNKFVISQKIKMQNDEADPEKNVHM